MNARLIVLALLFLVTAGNAQTFRPNVGGGSGSGGTINSGTADDVTYYSGTTTLDSNSKLSFPASGVMVNRTGSAAVDFTIQGDTEASLFVCDASADACAVGNATPGARFEVMKNSNAGSVLKITNTTSGTGAYAGIFLANNGGKGGFLEYRSAAYTGNTADSTFLGSGSADVGGLIVTTTWNETTARSLRLGVDDGAGTNGFLEHITIFPTTSAPYAGATVFNETGANVDLRVEGDTEGSLVFVDASADAVGIRNAAPLSTLDADGSLGMAVTNSSSSPVTVGATQHTFFCDATTGNVTFDLPAVATAERREYTFKKIDASANTCIIDGNGAETVEDGATLTLTLRYSSVQIQANATEWFITASHVAASVL